MRTVDILAEIDKQADAIGLPRMVARNIFSLENSDKSGTLPVEVPDTLTSPRGAVGPMQVIATTFENLKKQGHLAPDADIKNPVHNITAGLKVAKELWDRTGNDIAATYAGYNGGTAAVRAVQAGQQPPAVETQNYVNRGLNMEQPAGTATRTTVTTRSKDIDPSIAAVEFPNYLASQRTAFESLVNAALGKVETLTDAAGNVVASAEAGGRAMLSTADAAVAKLNNNDAILRAFSGGILDPDSQMAQAEARVIEARNRQAELKPIIDQENAVSIFDDPLRWAINQFKLPMLAQKYNAASADERIALTQQASISQKVAAQQGIEPALIGQQIKEAAVAQAEAERLQALAKASQLKGEAASTVSSVLMQHMALNNTTFELRLRMASMAADSLTRSEASKSDKALAGIVDLVNDKLKAVGANTHSLETFKFLKPETRDFLMSNARNSAALGGTPSEALKFLDVNSVWNQFSKHQPQAYQFLMTQAQRKAYDTKKNLLVQSNPKLAADPAELRGMTLDALEQDDRTAANAAVDTDALPADNVNSFNAYQIGKLASVDFGGPIKRDNFVLKYINDRKMADQEGRNPPKLHDIYNHAVAQAIVDPSKIPVLAGELATFMRDGPKLAWAKNGSAMLGFTEPVAVRMLTGNGSAPLALTNITQVENDLVQAFRKAKKAELYQVGSEAYGNPAMDYMLLSSQGKVPQ